MRQSNCPVYDFDTLIVFFQNCYYLRDWLETTRPELKDDIKILFDNSFELQGCRDICNGFKHKNLNKPSLDADFNIYREYDSLLARIDPTKNPEIYNIVFAENDTLSVYLEA